MVSLFYNFFHSFRWDTFFHPYSMDVCLNSLRKCVVSIRRTSMRHSYWVPTTCFNIGIKHGFPCVNICQVPWEVLKTEAEGCDFQHLPKDLANVNALKDHVWSLLLHKKWKHLLHFTLFLYYFISPLHWRLANAISTNYARSRAGQYTSRDGINFVALTQVYWK